MTRPLVEPGDIVKVKLGGDTYEVEVVKANVKTIWVKAQFARTRLAALSPKEKEEVARMPQSTEGLSEEEKALAALARAGKKIRHEKGTKIVKLPRARVIGQVSQREMPSRSEAKRLTIQKGGEIEEVTEVVESKREAVAEPSPLSAKDRLKAKLAARKEKESL